MKVRLIKKRTVEDYVQQNKASQIPFETWLDRLKIADWNTPSEIRNQFTGINILGGGSNRVIFDIGGNDYRLICKYVFCRKEVRLYICWIVTHAEYDKICSFNMQYTVSRY